MSHSSATLLLASTSVYRKTLLQKLGLPFQCLAPEVDETAHPGETAHSLVQRLALEKARAGSRLCPGALSIGSDQVAVIDNEIIGKPYTVDNACAQLARAAGKAVTFYTGLALLDGRSGHEQSSVEPFTVYFRQLTPEQIRFYVQQEQPLYCAGSFKCEGLGIALFEKLQGDDPNALIGLPLIALTKMLLTCGIDVLNG